MTVTFREIIDISRPLAAGMAVWPGTHGGEECSRRKSGQSRGRRQRASAQPVSALHQKLSRSCWCREHTRIPLKSAAWAGGPNLAIIAAVKATYIQAIEADDLPPGRMTCVEMGGKRILIANVDGVFYATDDTCTHEDASLATGSLKGELVKCPLHGSRFSLRTGEPLED